MPPVGLAEADVQERAGSKRTVLTLVGYSSATPDNVIVNDGASEMATAGENVVVDATKQTKNNDSN